MAWWGLFVRRRRRRLVRVGSSNWKKKRGGKGRRRSAFGADVDLRRSWELLCV